MCNVAEASGNSRVINSSHFENVISPTSLTGLPAPMPGAKLIGKNMVQGRGIFQQQQI